MQKSDSPAGAAPSAGQAKKEPKVDPLLTAQSPAPAVKAVSTASSTPTPPPTSSWLSVSNATLFLEGLVIVYIFFVAAKTAHAFRLHAIEVCVECVRGRAAAHVAPLSPRLGPSHSLLLIVPNPPPPLPPAPPPARAHTFLSPLFAATVVSSTNSTPGSTCERRRASCKNCEDELIPPATLTPPLRCRTTSSRAAGIWRTVSMSSASWAARESFSRGSTICRGTRSAAPSARLFIRGCRCVALVNPPSPRLRVRTDVPTLPTQRSSRLSSFATS